MYILIPRTDDQAGLLVRFIEENPTLKVVLGVSPAFAHVKADASLRQHLLDLQKAGRIEIALQIANAPVLPLLMNTEEARRSLPTSALLPNPPFRYPVDTAQVIGRAKAAFFKIWSMDPPGLVLPYGAASADLLKLLPRLHISWAVAALSAPEAAGAYRLGSVTLWDAAPQKESPAFGIEVLDERLSDPAQTPPVLKRWAAEAAGPKEAVLPSQKPEAQDWPPGAPVAARSWTIPDWSLWIGTPGKNRAWQILRKVRETIEDFKNSGTSEGRVDLVFEEMYALENANYLAGLGALEPAPGSEDREHEFQASVAGIYRLMGAEPPDDLFTQAAASATVQVSTATPTWEKLPNGLEHGILPDPSGDDHGDGTLLYPAALANTPGAFDLQSLEITVSSDSLDFAVALGSEPFTSLGNSKHPGPLIDIYMDLNHQPQAGTLPFLAGRGAGASDMDAWEYAFCLQGSKATLYRTHDTGSYEPALTLPLQFEANRVHVRVPRDLLRGNPRRWGYQVLVMFNDMSAPDSMPVPAPAVSTQREQPYRVYDLLDPPDLPQSQLLSDLEDNKRNTIPFVRFPATK